MNFLKYLDCCYKFYDDCCNDRLYIPDAKGCLHKAKIYYEPWGEPIGFFFYGRRQLLLLLAARY